MLLNKQGQRLKTKTATFSVGQRIGVTKTPYKDILGTIHEIRTGADKMTSSIEPEVHCDLDWPINYYMEQELLDQLSEQERNAMDRDDVMMKNVVFAPSELRAVRYVRLYQVDVSGIDRNTNSHPALKYLFCNYQTIKDMGLEAPPGEFYRIVYDDMLGTDLLGDISYIFNISHPEGYKGRSLTQSDIVELYGENSSNYYYADTIGYKEIPTFRPGSREV